MSYNHSWRSRLNTHRYIYLYTCNCIFIRTVMMCVYISVHTYKCIPAYMFICVCVYKCIYAQFRRVEVHIKMFTCKHAYIQKSVYIYMYMYIYRIHVCIYVHLYMYLYVYIYTYTYICVWVYTDTHHRIKQIVSYVHMHVYINLRMYTCHAVCTCKNDIIFGYSRM